MTETEKAGFVAALTELAALKPGAVLTERQYGAWWAHFREGWTLDEFRAACRTLADSVAFMPNPFHFAQLRKTAQLVTNGDVWKRVVAHARELPTHGGYLQEIPSGDAELDAVVRAVGGFKAIANASERDLQFIQQRFNERLEERRSAGDARQALPHLAPEIGLVDGPTRGPKRLGSLS